MDPIGAALEHYRSIAGYQATIKSIRADGGEVIRYYYRQPGLVRMEFVKPHKGAVLIYKPDKRRVYLWPLGHGLLPPMALSPDNVLLQSPTGQTIDRSDVGALLENVRTLQRGGRTEVLGEEAAGSRRATVHVMVAGRPGATLGRIHRYDLWLDRGNDFPIQVVSFDTQGRAIEKVMMEDVQLNPVLPEQLFHP
ncbi:MAG TPA: DUF1571 domain-containing protein [Burkholderiaceae bacterium]|jgi:outer membrane lipoprotein-sorting protein|nr:DUF1571 domain-containing protein [Burkholderiaceae bacterium]